MKNTWHFLKSDEKLMEEIFHRKVTHVVEYNNIANHNFIYWKGELDNDKYFMIQVLDGVVMITISEKEEALNTTNCIPVVYVDDVKDIIDETDEWSRLQKLMNKRLDFLPKFMLSLTFEEIMSIFMWKYASESVEVYEYTFV